MTIILYLSKGGVRNGCGKRQCTPSRQQVAHNETAEPLMPLSCPTLSHSVQPADRKGQRCIMIRHAHPNRLPSDQQQSIAYYLSSALSRLKLSTTTWMSIRSGNNSTEFLTNL